MDNPLIEEPVDSAVDSEFEAVDSQAVDFEARALESRALESGTSSSSGSSLSTPAKWWLYTVLLSSGAVTLLFWNAAINLALELEEDYFPAHSNLTNMMTLVFELFALVAATAMCFTDELHLRWSALLPAASLLLALLTPLLLLVAHAEARWALWVVLTAGYGAFCGAAQVHYFGVAANLPWGVKTVLVSSGQGLAGLVSYVLYELFIDWGRRSTMVGVVVPVLAQVCFTAVGGWGVYRLRASRLVEAHIRRQRRLLAREVAAQGRTSLLAVAKLGWFPIFNTALTFFVSYLVFPNTGPFRWSANAGDSQISELTGVPPLAVWLGRSVPIWPLFLVETRTCFILNLLRLAWPVLFVCTAVFKHVHLFGEWWWQVLLLFTLSFGEGWLGTVGLCRSAMAGKNLQQTALLSTLSVIALSAGLCLSLAVAPGLQAALHI